MDAILPRLIYALTPNDSMKIFSRDRDSDIVSCRDEFLALSVAYGVESSYIEQVIFSKS